MEIALDMAELTGKDRLPVKGTVWYGNLCKNGYLPEKTGRPVEEFFDEYYYAGVWCYTRGDNHRNQDYGYLIFR